MSEPTKSPPAPAPAETQKANSEKTGPTGARNGAPSPDEKPAEFGGPAGPEPTRYGDWERNGRVSDF